MVAVLFERLSNLRFSIFSEPSHQKVKPNDCNGRQNDSRDGCPISSESAQEKLPRNVVPTTKNWCNHAGNSTGPCMKKPPEGRDSSRPAANEIGRIDATAAKQSTANRRSLRR